MKKLYLLLAAFVTLTFGASAQTADQIMDRYYKESGFEKLAETKADQNIMMEMIVKGNGMEMPVKGIVQYPSKMRIEMSVSGQDMLMILNGKKGWMVTGGMKQPLPAAMVEQASRQNDILGNMKWDKSKYDMELLEPVTENGNTYDVIKAAAKATDAPVAEQLLYFDRNTGLIAYTKATFDHEGIKIEATTVFDDYTDMNGIKFPKTMKTSAGNNVVAEITIKNLEFNYPVEERMFAEPQ